MILGLVLFFANAPENMKARHAELDEQQLTESERVPFKSVGWYEAYDEQQKIKAESEPIGKFLKKLTDKPGGWTNNPIKAFFVSPAEVEAKKTAAEKAYNDALSIEEVSRNTARTIESQAGGENFEDEEMNDLAIAAIEAWRINKKRLDSAKKKYNVSAVNKLPGLLGLLVFLGLLFTIGAAVMGTKASRFLIGFLFVFVIGLLSYLLAGQASMKAIGFGYAAWAILIGLLISNTVGTPEWVKPALSTEFYIKTGLVLLGAEILFGKILVGALYVVLNCLIY